MMVTNEQLCISVNLIGGGSFNTKIELSLYCHFQDLTEINCGLIFSWTLRKQYKRLRDRFLLSHACVFSMIGKSTAKFTIFLFKAVKDQPLKLGGTFRCRLFSGRRAQNGPTCPLLPPTLCNRYTDEASLSSLICGLFETEVLIVDKYKDQTRSLL